ncbi:MAG: methyltransferase domain-containing protein [Thermoplasmata archaeon]|nr:methyltransferase domain-containing protein [Thermoplasmata archaeon]
MKLPGWAVPVGQAEQVRQELRARDLLAPGVRWLHEGGEVVMPLRLVPTPSPWVGRLVEREFGPAERGNPRSYTEFMTGLSPEIREQLPRAFDVVGDIVLVRIPRELEALSEPIGQALLRFVPGARVVAADLGVHGPERRRSLRRVAGDGGFSTVHRENGIAIEVDLEAAYFSPRLSREHARVAGAVRAGERLLDLCCGVGPFTLLAARQGRAHAIVAVDGNPAAIALLRRNLERLRSTVAVEPILAEASEFLLEPRVFDRAILNLPMDGARFLPALGSHFRPGGAVHYFEVVERADRPGFGERVAAALGEGWRAGEERTVHAYSPRSDLVGLTISRTAD